MVRDQPTMAAAWVEVLPWVRVASRSSGRARRIVGAVVTGRTVAPRRRRPHALIRPGIPDVYSHRDHDDDQARLDLAGPAQHRGAAAWPDGGELRGGSLRDLAAGCLLYT